MSGPFKFLKREDLHYVQEQHTLVVSTPAYFEAEYKAMERKNPAINDPREAKTYGVHEPIVGRTMTDTDKRVASALGFKITGRAEDVTFVDNQVIYGMPQCFILSLAKGYFPDLERVFTAPPVNYSACLRIHKPRELWTHMLRDGCALGQPMAALFKGFTYGPVEYSEINFKVGVEDHIVPDPFRKHLSFANQCEWRLVLYPTRELKEQRLIVTIPQLSNYVSKVELTQRPVVRKPRSIAFDMPLASNCTIEGATIKNFDIGIRATDSDGVRLKNLTFDKVANPIELNNPTRTHVERVTVIDPMKEK